MKVVMVETGGWGGLAHYTWNLCSALSDTGTDVCLLTNIRYELENLPRKFRIDPCFDKAVGYIQTISTLMRRLSQHAPDIVHVQSLISTRFDSFLWPRVRRRIPVVFTAHNTHSHEGGGWENWTLWRCLRMADAVIVHTKESAQFVVDQVGYTGHVKLIHHGDYEFFAEEKINDRATVRRRLDLPMNAKILLAFGAIRPYKGILGLIAALRQVRIRYPDAHLVIAGPLLVGTEEEYRSAIKNGGVEDAVTFRPHYVECEKVAAYFAAADAAVYNYRDITDSGALRIACVLGTPVVATAVGGFREFLTDRVSARLVPPDTPDLLAAAICDIFADPFQATKMVEAARTLSASKWSWTDSAKATLELYRETLHST